MRTIQVLLDDFAPNTDITAKIDGTTVYSGPIDSDTPMFTFQVPIEFQGKKSLSMKVNSGIATTQRVTANYTLLPNPVFSEEEKAIMYDPGSTVSEKLPIVIARANPSLTPDQQAVLEDESATPEEIDVVLRATHTTGAVTTGPTGYNNANGPGDVFSSVEIDGIPQPLPPEPGSEDWAHIVYEGSVMTADINILFGIEFDTSLDLNPVM